MHDPAAMFGFDPPEIDAATAVRVAAEHWGVTGEPDRLRGERSHNTRITAGDGQAWILQVQSASEHPAVIDLQTRAMRHVAHRRPELPVSRVVTTRSGELHAEVELDGRPHLARLVTYLPGITFDPTETLPGRAYEAIGELIGSVAAGLGDFEHPAASHPMPWDVANGLAVDGTLREGMAPGSAAAVAALDDRLRSAADTMAALPRRIVHNDGHAGNLIRRDPASHQVCGIIDFGDLVHTVTAADVAIIAESFAPDHPDPAAVVAAVTVGYHRHVPLSDAEIAAIPELVLVRTALNVVLGDFQIRHAPHLAAGAEATRSTVVDRMERWGRLDAGAMVARIHDAVARPEEAPR